MFWTTISFIIRSSWFTVFCSSVQTVQTCLTAVVFKTSKSWTPDDERNGRSKHVELYINCRTNTYRRFILACLYNWLRCTVHTASKKELLCLTMILLISQVFTAQRNKLFSAQSLQKWHVYLRGQFSENVYRQPVGHRPHHSHEVRHFVDI